MDMYQWILKQEGFKVSKTGYFVYVNGDQHFEDGMLENEIDKANMKFDVQLITYDGDCSWVEETIMKLQKCLRKKKCPSHSKSGFGPKGDKQCEYAELFDGMQEHNLI